MEKELPVFRIQEIVNINRENVTLKTDCKDTYVLSCRLYGESTFFYKGRSIIVKRGDLLYIPRGASYCQSCEAEEIVAVHFEVIGNMIDEIRVITPEDPEAMRRAFDDLARRWQEKTTDAFFACMAQLYQLVSSSHILDGAASGDAYGAITPAVTYLRFHLYDKSLTMEAVYRQTTLSQTSFIKHFHACFGCTPVKYVNRERVQKAKRLLRSQSYTRQEIATLCGFENVKHFYVVFKNITGYTTGEYLKKE